MTLDDAINRINTDAKEMLDLLINYNQSDKDLLSRINIYLNKVRLLDSFEYIIDGKKIDLCMDFDFDDKDELKLPISDDYNFITLYALLVKWLITGNEKTYHRFLSIFEDEYAGGCMMPVDRYKYWIDHYADINNLPIEPELIHCVVNIDYFWSVYKKYVLLYLKEHSAKNKIKVFDSDSENLGIANFLVFKIMDCEDRYNKLNITPSYEQYMHETRDIPYEAQVHTGGCIIDSLHFSLEAMSMLRIVLKKKGIQNREYLKLYNMLSRCFEDIINTLYEYRFEYENDSFVSNELYKTSEYRTNYAIKYAMSVTEGIVKNDVESLLQSKQDFMPIFINSNPEIAECIDKNIDIICAQLKNNLALSDDVLNKRELLVNEFQSVYKELNIPDDIFDTLATAEYLFSNYIDEKEPLSGWDYSFVSILYYQVLEKALNYYAYVPYVTEINNMVTAENSSLYFSNAKCTQINYRNKSVSIKPVLELGPIGFLMKSVAYGNNKYTDFLTNKYDNINIFKIGKYGEKVIEVSKRRNHAAHAQILSFDDAKEDKYIIYCNKEEFTSSIEARNMVKELFFLLTGRK